MSRPLRVALFTDSFGEANGVATLSRQFASFAQNRDIPFFCVHGGAKTRVVQEHSLTTVELKRGLASFHLDPELKCDVLLSRYKNWVTEQLRPFKADVVHITSPGDMGWLGFWISFTLGVPLVASWHTNLHEYAARRLDKMFSFAPDCLRNRMTGVAEHQCLRGLVRFYRMARFLMAPNEAMVRLLHERTHRPTFLMPHGVDIQTYSPEKSTRRGGPFCIGYVGRLTPEKNVRALADLETSLIAAGQTNFRILVVGEGTEKEWLRKHLRRGEIRGILRGEALAAAFAEMDLFVFPSRTDTFGLVLLEAMASGVPVVLSPEAGARVGVKHGETGFLAPDFESLALCVLDYMSSESMRGNMGVAAREFACRKAWDGVFEEVYDTYDVGLRASKRVIPRTDAISPAI